MHAKDTVPQHQTNSVITYVELRHIYTLNTHLKICAAKVIFQLYMVLAHSSRTYPPYPYRAGFRSLDLLGHPVNGKIYIYMVSQQMARMDMYDGGFALDPYASRNLLSFHQQRTTRLSF
jgi:hypothetical protein